MANKKSKILKNLLNTGRNIVDDLHEEVTELRQTVVDLEKIVRKLQESNVNDTNDTEHLVDKNGQAKDCEFPDNSHHHLIKCDSCDKTFKNVSDLEKHIKTKHEAYKIYTCDI